MRRKVLKIFMEYNDSVKKIIIYCYYPWYPHWSHKYAG